MSDDNGSGKVVWFMAGIAIGATISLMYAPAAGHVTRRKLAKRTNEGRRALEDTGRDVLERGKEMYERGRKLADEAADMFERGRKMVESTAANLKG